MAKTAKPTVPDETAKQPRRKQPARKKKKAVSVDKSCLSLCDMPQEILEKIIGYNNIWHRNRIRGTCKRLQSACDSMLKHELKMNKFKYFRQDPKGQQYNALAAIVQATWAYDAAGFHANVMGTMLPLMRSHYRNPFCPDVSKIKIFLENFYKMAEQKLGRDSQVSRLLYALTLFGLLKKFDNLTLLTSDDVFPQHWRVVYELPGTWIGMLWTPRPSSNLTPISNPYHLLILFADILIGVNSNTSFKRVWDAHDQPFVYGHEGITRTRMPKTELLFNVYGSKRIINLLKTAVDTKNWGTLPKDELELNLEIRCKEALKWGCCTSISVHLKKPFGDFTEISQPPNEIVAIKSQIDLRNFLLLRGLGDNDD